MLSRWAPLPLCTAKALGLGLYRLGERFNAGLREHFSYIQSLVKSSISLQAASSLFNSVLSPRFSITSSSALHS